jgi:hypothetical protein
METAMKELNLPEPIAAYFEADRGDSHAVARCFTNEAVVTDEGQTHAGLPAIKAWKAAASAQYSYVTEPVALEKTDRKYVVTSRVTGDFPGSPVDLRFIFALERGRIVSLEITP